MKDRIKKLRKEKHLTQQELADKIGIARGNISAYEVGKNAPSDAVIRLICQEFSINETWLREGTGNIFIEKPKNQIISEFVTDLIKEPASFKTRFFQAMTELDERDWITIEKIFDKMNRM